MKTFKRCKQILLALLLSAPLAGVSLAADVTVNLVAEQVNKTMPGGVIVPMWGLRLASAPAGSATIPGPAIAAVAGDRLIINLTNTLPEPVSLVINGQKPTEDGALVPTWTDGTTGPRGNNATKRVRSFTHEAAPSGGTASYRWPNLRPGTYLIQSGTHPGVQVPMGLYAALKVDVVIDSQAYDIAATTSYDTEALLLFSEVDPAQHAAVAAGTYGTASYPSTLAVGYEPKFFLINGKAYPAGSPIPLVKAGQRVLLRFLNAGLRTRIPVLLNGYLQLIAEDGNPLPSQPQQYSLDLAAGKTLDAVFTPAKTTTYAIHDRALGLTNGKTGPGGMIVQFGPAKPAQVISPNGGEVLTSGSVFPIRWQAAAGAAGYTLRFSADKGTTWTTIANVGKVTSFNWTVPGVATSQALVRVIAKDAGGATVAADQSNSPFTIQP
jgi:FtsP/CotA-like multicopper oxidase with cupredoxin domain